MKNIFIVNVKYMKIYCIEIICIYLKVYKCINMYVIVYFWIRF